MFQTNKILFFKHLMLLIIEKETQDIILQLQKKKIICYDRWKKPF